MADLYVIHCGKDFGDGESGPMVYDWFEIVEAKDVGEAWLNNRGATVRPATEKEKAGYHAYKEEVRKFKDLGISEEDVPFGIHDFVDFEDA